MHGLWECFWVWFCLIQCTDCESVSGCVSVWYNARIVRVFLGVILSDKIHGLWKCFWVWFCLIQCTDCESVSGCVSDTMHGIPWNLISQRVVQFGSSGNAPNTHSKDKNLEPMPRTWPFRLRQYSRVWPTNSIANTTYLKSTLAQKVRSSHAVVLIGMPIEI